MKKAMKTAKEANGEETYRYCFYKKVWIGKTVKENRSDGLVAYHPVGHIEWRLVHVGTYTIEEAYDWAIRYCEEHGVNREEGIRVIPETMARKAPYNYKG